MAEGGKKELDSSNSSIGHERFRAGPPLIAKIHTYLVRDLNMAESGGERSAEFVDRICQITLETFWTEIALGEEGLAC